MRDRIALVNQVSIQDVKFHYERTASNDEYAKKKKKQKRKKKSMSNYTTT
jgi:hypothetical protein